MSMKKKVVISKKPCSRCGSAMWHFAGQKFPEKLNLCAGCIARSELASKAGKAAAKKLTAKQRKTRATKASHSRKSCPTK